METLAEIDLIPLILDVPPVPLAVPNADEGDLTGDTEKEEDTVTDREVMAVYIADGEFDSINETDILLVAEITSVTLP